MKLTNTKFSFNTYANLIDILYQLEEDPNIPQELINELNQILANNSYNKPDEIISFIQNKLQQYL